MRFFFKLIIFILFITMISCTDDYVKMKETQGKFFMTIQNNDYQSFRKMIAHKKSTMEDNHDFPLLQRLYKQSEIYKGDYKITIIDSLNDMGQTVIKVPYFKGYDSITAITNIDVFLYFGPKKLFSFNKLSEFETEYKWNSKKHREILGLPPLTNIQDSIKKNTGKTVIDKF